MSNDMERVHACNEIVRKGQGEGAGQGDALITDLGPHQSKPNVNKGLLFQPKISIAKLQWPSSIFTMHAHLIQMNEEMNTPI